jgi:hypothetical protein
MESINKELSPTERRLFKEHIIHEYKAKHNIVHNAYDTIHDKLKSFMHINIIVGIFACVGVIY